MKHCPKNSGAFSAFLHKCQWEDKKVKLLCRASLGGFMICKGSMALSQENTPTVCKFYAENSNSQTYKGTLPTLILLLMSLIPPPFSYNVVVHHCHLMDTSALEHVWDSFLQ